MKGHGRPAHQVWLPPLDVPQLAGPAARRPRRRPRARAGRAAWRERGDYVLPVGIVDRPLEQRRELYVLAPRRRRRARRRRRRAALGPPDPRPHHRHGHRADDTPRSRARSTSSTSAAAPSRRWPSCRTSPGSPTAASPRWCAGSSPRCAASSTPARRYFRANGIDSIETYRRRRAEGRVDDGYGDVFLVVDGWPTMRAEFDELEPQITALAGRGLTFGVHVVVTTSRWMDFRTRSATRSAPASSCGSATPATPRSTAGSPPTCPRAAPAVASTHRQAPHARARCRASTTAGSVDDLGDGRRGPGRPGQRRVDGPARPEAAAAPGARSPSRRSAARRPRRRRPAARRRRGAPRAHRPRPRRGPAPLPLRRRRQRQDRASCAPSPTR